MPEVSKHNTKSSPCVCAKPEEKPGLKAPREAALVLPLPQKGKECHKPVNPPSLFLFPVSNLPFLLYSAVQSERLVLELLSTLKKFLKKSFSRRQNQFIMDLYYALTLL